MNVFLTGEIGIGKSTAVSRVVSRLGVKAGGFLTTFGVERGVPHRSLFLVPAWVEPPPLVEANVVARFGQPGEPPVPDTAAFDECGPACLAASLPWAEVILMDELGSMEREALLFQHAVLDCLDQDIPVLGVLKERGHPWMDAISGHPGVMVHAVTLENRDSLVDVVCDELSAQC
ncbi:nucleoside-triphosphatase [Propionibacterium sp.]|uniref:nucleoside-triphosphatase n=1 Tax=Propionibacterium sp. TaxID=1977903 RepID=UPI0039ED92A3